MSSLVWESAVRKTGASVMAAALSKVPCFVASTGTLILSRPAKIERMSESIASSYPVRRSPAIFAPLVLRR